jgi:hypothetical protein
METVEIIVFGIFAIILGSILVGFFTGWEYLDFYKDTKEQFEDNEYSGRLRELTKEEFFGAIIDFWKQNYPSDNNNSMNVFFPGNSTKKELFASIKELRLCKTLQSTQHDCGTREDIVFNDVNGSNIIKLSYYNKTLRIN